MTLGTYFNVQRYSIHDGPGIRTILFLKGCPLHCPWCANPESQKVGPEIEYTASKCIGCGYCIKVCEAQALSMTEVGIFVDREKCTVCGKCTDRCVAHALEQVGTPISVEEAFKAITGDRAFYEKSGGGVTISGGEPLMQIQFITELLKRCKEDGINTAIETTGFQKWSEIEKILPYVDVFLYDIKHMDSEKHKKIMGVDNSMILENAAKITAAEKTLIVRIPVIPGYNDNLDNLCATVKYAADIHASAVNLLPYHRLGVNKYGILGKTYALSGIMPPTELEMKEALAAVQIYDIPVSIGG